MLGITLSPRLNDAAWRALDRTARAPDGYDIEDLLAQDEAGYVNSRRCRLRYPLPGRAVLSCRELATDEFSMFGVYTTNLSAMGLGFCSPVQLFPKQQVELYAANLENHTLIVRRCRRLQKDCYLCGATFTAGALPPGAFRQLIDQLRG